MRIGGKKDRVKFTVFVCDWSKCEARYELLGSDGRTTAPDDWTLATEWNRDGYAGGIILCPEHGAELGQLLKSKQERDETIQRYEPPAGLSVRAARGGTSRQKVGSGES